MTSLSIALTRLALVICAIYYTVLGTLLYFAPRLFFERFGGIGAFNAHYSRDVGSFTLPLGIALFFLAQKPERYRLFAWYALLGSALHAASHVVDGATGQKGASSFAFFVGVTAVLCLPLFLKEAPL